MSLNIAGETIERVVIIDDEDNSRENWSCDVSDAGLVPESKPGPLGELQAFFSSLCMDKIASLCDHNLKKSQYAHFNGAEAVSEFYNNHIPSILCTRYTKSDIDSIRKYLRFIPVLFEPEELNPESITKGFEICINEFKNSFLPNRKSWRTLIRVEDIDNETSPAKVFVVLPGWNTNETIGIPIDLIPNEYHHRVHAEARFHAHVNKGVEDQNRLYFENFEFD